MAAALITRFRALFTGTTARNTEMRDARARFEQACRDRDIDFAPRPDGRYDLETPSGVMQVALDNIAAMLRGAEDPAAEISGFIDQFMETGDLPERWEDAAPGLILRIHPAPMTPPNDLLQRPVGRRTRMLVSWESRATAIRSVSRSQAARWGVPEDAVWQAAEAAMRAALDGAELVDLSRGGPHRAFLLKHDRSWLEAALIFAPGFRDWVGERLEGPALALIPLRDEALLCDDEAALDRLLVQAGRGFLTEAHPASDEIFRIDEDGATAFARMPLDDPDFQAAMGLG